MRDRTGRSTAVVKHTSSSPVSSRQAVRTPRPGSSSFRYVFTISVLRPRLNAASQFLLRATSIPQAARELLSRNGLLGWLSAQTPVDVSERRLLISVISNVVAVLAQDGLAGAADALDALSAVMGPNDGTSISSALPALVAYLPLRSRSRRSLLHLSHRLDPRRAPPPLPLLRPAPHPRPSARYPRPRRRTPLDRREGPDRFLPRCLGGGIRSACGGMGGEQVGQGVVQCRDFGGARSRGGGGQSCDAQESLGLVEWWNVFVCERDPVQARDVNIRSGLNIFRPRPLSANRLNT